MRYFFHIGYHGFQYHGWQRQLGAMSVQEIIEDALSSIFQDTITIVGCGRTDAQVSASQYFFHTEFKDEWDFDLKFRLNKLLPSGIAIFDIIPVEKNHHARFDAVKRTYDYFIHTTKNPFISQTSSFYQIENLDLAKMKEAVNLLSNYSDYRFFCKSPDKHHSTICNVTHAQLFNYKNGEKIRFQITSNRFLKGMIRIIVGKLLEIGKGECTIEEFENALKTTAPLKLIKPAYPQGLYLSKVTYPYLDMVPQMDFSTILQNNVDVVWENVTSPRPSPFQGEGVFKNQGI